MPLLRQPSAPATTVLPSMLTRQPTKSLLVALATFSCAVSVVSAQPLSGSANPYTAPCPVKEPTVWFGAPTTTLVPLIATDRPKYPCATPSEDVSFAVCVMSPQPLADMTNTYAAPCWKCETVAKGAPATTAPPLIATKLPRRCPGAPSEAVSFAVCVVLCQPLFGSANT